MSKAARSAAVWVVWLSAGCTAAPDPVDPAAYVLQSSGAEAQVETATVSNTETDAATVPGSATNAASATVSAADADTVSATGTNSAADTDTDSATDTVSASATDAVEHAPATSRGSVTVEMRGFKNARGQVLVALWRTGRGFPDHAGRAFGKARTNVDEGRARVVFEDVPPGPFAVVVHHDEDRDFQMDTGLMGIPAEGYGFSRDAHASFGPPSFDDARLWLGPGAKRRVRIHMRY